MRDPLLLQAWREGVEEFNSGRYYEAHEKWEFGWKNLPEPERSWVQAWIQLAGVLCLKQKQGREEAARALCASALEKLERARSVSSVSPRIEVEGGEEFLRLNSALTQRKGLKAKLV